MPLLDRTPTRRVLILGGGFGGTYAALELEKILARDGSGAFEVTLVTRDNFFLFTPMLHEVAASDLELSTIVNPLRKLLGRVNTFVGTIEAIDVASRRVTVSHGVDRHTHDLPYDHVVLALGSRTNFYGPPDHAPRGGELRVRRRRAAPAPQLRRCRRRLCRRRDPRRYQ